MTEFELKLEIPAHRLASVRAAMREGKAGGKRLRASYFDTPDDALAGAQISLRVRKEGRAWVQTAKCAGDGPLARLEHEVPLGVLPAAAAPAVSLLRHAATPIGEAIGRALEVKSLDQAPALQLRFETDVRRLARRIEYSGSLIEVALDHGKVVAGGAQTPLCEIEFELIEGDAVDAVRLAGQWLATHGLWLSTISKSAKGRRLAAGQSFGAPVGAIEPRLRRQSGGGEIAAAVLQACVEQVLGNASEIAAGSVDADHIHQLRVGIRRLRTALRELGAFLHGVDAAWERALVDAFRALGRHRDHGHLARSVQPQLEAHGAPRVNIGAADHPPDPGEVVRSPAFQAGLLGLLELVQSAAGGEGGAVEPGKAMAMLTTRLEKLRAQIEKDGRRFQILDRVRQHRVRKRLKRLRYLAEFVAPLFPTRKARNFVAALKPVQEALGGYNDELAALEAYRNLAAREPAAWFGVGWLAARRAPNAKQCERELERFTRVKAFWD